MADKDSSIDERLRRRSVRFFILYSTLAILIIGAMIGWYMVDAIQLEMVEAYGLATHSQVNRAINSLLTPEDLKSPPNAAEYRRLNKNMQRITAGTAVAEIKIWRPDGTVIYSRDRRQVGKKYPVSDELEGALKGRPVYNFSELGEEHQAREREKYANLIEIYYPLRLVGGPGVDGAFEVRVSVGPLIRDTRHVFGYAAAGMGSLALLLIIFAQVASRLLRGRNDELRVMEGDLRDKAGALERSRERWRAIADTAVDAIVSIDPEGRIIFWNPAAARIFGHSVEEAAGRDVTMLMPERFREDHNRALSRAAAGGSVVHTGTTMELIALRKNGQEFPIALSLAESRTHDEHTFISIIRDVTESKEMEDALKDSERRFRTLVENTSECICKLDLDGNFQFMNPAGLRTYGFTDMSEVIGRHVTELAEPEYRDLLLNGLEEAKSGSVTRFQYRSRTPEGLRWFESVLSPQVDSRGNIESLVCISADITGRKEVEDRLRYLSTHDSLTGLENRGAFFNSLDREVEHSRRYGRPFSMVMLDLDHFKNINDTFGHPAGDTVLRAVAENISETCRAADVVCRYGGEEFTVIMPESDFAAARPAAERIRGAVAARDIVLGGGPTVHVTISAGVASFPADADNGKDLVDASDASLYHAKEAGRNRVWPAA